MKKISRWLPAIVLMGVIFLFSSIPSEEMPSLGFWDTLIKKGGHMLGYGMLALAFWFALKWKGKHAWTALIFAIIYGLLDEFHQSFVPGRNPSLIDALGFDGGGATVLLLITYWWKKRLLQPFKNKEN
jgi:VanZ family protein